MTTLRFAVATTPDLGGPAFAELRSILAAREIDLEPVYVPNYVSLFETVHLHAADVAWCPPLVARDLVRVAAADPIATVLRGGADHYYSAIVAREESHVHELRDLDTARVGWVSRLSAAGYVVPRDFLSALGVAVERLDESFFHTHGRLVRALIEDEVDVIATYASSRDGGFELSPALDGARILGVAGQIPGDVIVASRALAHSISTALGCALRDGHVRVDGALARLLNASGFGFVAPDHLGALARWVERPVQATLFFSRDASRAHARHNPQRGAGSET